MTAVYREHEFRAGDKVRIRRGTSTWTVLFVTTKAVVLGRRGQVRHFRAGAMAPAEHVDLLTKVPSQRRAAEAEVRGNR